jgi:hypothetical protein
MVETNLNETLKAIDAVIAERREAIKLGEALNRLMKNQDFIDVILEGYINKEAKKLFAILTDPSGKSPYSAEKIHLMLEAISHFKGYVGTDDFEGTIMMEARRAPQDIAREEDYRKQVTANADNGDY